MVRDRPTDIATYRAAIAAKKLLGRLQKSGQIKNKRCGCTFNNQSCNSSLFKVSFLGFVDATVMCIIKYCHSHDQRASLESTLHNENAQDMILISLSYS